MFWHPWALNQHDSFSYGLNKSDNQARPPSSENFAVNAANRFSDAIARNDILKPAKDIAEMQTIVFSNQINAVLCGFFMIVAIVMLFAAIGVIRRALADPNPSVHESEAIYSDEISTGEVK